MGYLIDNSDADIIYIGDFEEALNEKLLLPLDDLIESHGKIFCPYCRKISGIQPKRWKAIWIAA